MQQSPDPRHDAAPPATHESSVHSLSFSSDGRWLASGGFDGWVKVWDVATGEVVLSLDGGMSEGVSPRAVFLPGEPSVAVTTLTGVEIRDAHTGALRRSLHNPEHGFDWMQPSGNGRIVVSAGLELSSWDVFRSEKLETLARRDQTFYCHAASADGRVIAASCFGPSVQVLDLRRGSAIRELPAGFRLHVHEVAVSPDGETVAACGDEIRLWNVSSGELRCSLSDERSQFFSLAFSPDGRLLSSGTQAGNVLVWEVGARAILARSSPLAGWVRALAFSPDGKKLAAAGNDHTIAILEVPTGRVIRRLGYRNEVRSVVFVPGTQLLASGHEDGEVRLWSVDTRSLTRAARLHETAITAIAVSPDGRTVASAGNDGTVLAWDLISDSVQHVWRFGDPASDVTFSPDGSLLAAASRPQRGCLGVGTVRVLDVASGASVCSIERELRGHVGFGRSVRFARAGTLVAATDHAQVHLFSARTGDLIHALGPPRKERRFSGDTLTALAAASGGDLLAAGDCGLGLWIHDLRTGAVTHARNDRDGTRCIAFSPDGSCLAVGTSHAHHVSIHAAAEGTITAKLVGHRHAIESVTYSAGGELLATGSRDGSIKLWDTVSTMVVATMRPPQSGEVPTR